MSQPIFDVTTVGELLVQLSVPAGHRLQMATHFDVCAAGTEANAMVALGCLGRRCAWVGGLPDSALGRLVTNPLRRVNIDLSRVVWSKNGRLGTYYVEFAVPPRQIQVIYDRADSCAAHLGPADMDWDYLLHSRLVHLTGITPALSDTCYDLVSETIKRAKAAGIPVSFDINYRQKLWTEQEAGTGLLPLIQGIELLLCARADAIRLFGCQGTPEEILNRLIELSGAHHIVLTLGNQGVIAWDGQQLLREPAAPVQIIDRIGAGDALAAGVIHGWLDGNFARGLRAGVTLAALALSQRGDMVVTTKEELTALMDDRSGGIVR